MYMSVKQSVYICENNKYGMKKNMHHILMLLICIVSIICSGDAVANAKCVHSTFASNEVVSLDGDNGFSLIDCDAMVVGKASALVDGESVPMRICDEQPPVRWSQSRGSWGRLPIGKQNVQCNRLQCVQIVATAFVKASVHFPLCLSANERIVALRHIIR